MAKDDQAARDSKAEMLREQISRLKNQDNDERMREMDEEEP